jgi:hypothetical protein
MIPSEREAVPVSDAVKTELLRLCTGGRRDRIVEFSRSAPVHWNVFEAIDPETAEPYTEDAAWNRIAAEIAGGCAVNAIVLDKPPGKTGYVLHFTDGVGERIYVKLQLGSGKVIGRSFHIG